MRFIVMFVTAVCVLFLIKLVDYLLITHRLLFDVIDICGGTRQKGV